MAYEKQEWKCGDTVTADKLNHMEDGIESANSGGGSAPLIFTVIMRSATTEECPLGLGGDVNEYSHSWQEIHDALVSGKPCFYKAIEGDSVYLYAIKSAVSQEGSFYINTSQNEYAFDFADANSKTLVACSDR